MNSKPTAKDDKHKQRRRGRVPAAPHDIAPAAARWSHQKELKRERTVTPRTPSASTRRLCAKGGTIVVYSR
jgi:hypothetical protein